MTPITSGKPFDAACASNGPFTIGATHGRQRRTSPPVWATTTCASADGHPVIDEVAIHRHPASCNIGSDDRRLSQCCYFMGISHKSVGKMSLGSFCWRRKICGKFKYEKITENSSVDVNSNKSKSFRSGRLTASLHVESKGGFAWRDTQAVMRTMCRRGHEMRLVWARLKDHSCDSQKLVHGAQHYGASPLVSRSVSSQSLPSKVIAARFTELGYSHWTLPFLVCLWNIKSKDY